MNASAVDHRIETSATINSSVWKWTVANGNSGSTIRRNPYAATFETTPENTATAGIGIDLYPSASQPWNGTTGIFTRNANAKHRKIHSCEACESGRCWSAENAKLIGVPCWSDASTPVAIAATSMKNEPTSV